MSNSRSNRRRQARGSSNAPPPRRDFMYYVYLAGGVFVLIVIGFFLYLRWQQNATYANETSTPTPAPSSAASSAPAIQLADGETLGKPLIKVSKSGVADTQSGGQGQAVDGITCGGEYATLHVHSHLSIFFNGKQIEVPRLIGGSPNPPPGCLYWIHTHSPDGIIHIESPVLEPEGSSGFDLGMLFDIWGQPLTRTNIAGLQGPVTAYVNGALYDGDLRQIPLKAHQQIVLEIGKTVPPPNYAFPPAD